MIRFSCKEIIHDGDMEAARNVALDLPETGVCSVNAGNTACCGIEARPKKTTNLLPVVYDASK